MTRALALTLLSLAACDRAPTPAPAPAPAPVEAPAPAPLDAAPAEDVSTVDVAPDVPVVVDAPAAPARPRRPARPSRPGAACDDRVGCAGGMVCCTHGGIPMPPTHSGRFMSARGCNTIPMAPPGR